jgi:soluble lytic murein transglycosylase
MGAVGLAWGLTACSSVDAQQPQHTASTTLDLVYPPEASSRHLPARIAPLVISPTLHAVIAAREAMTRRQWSVLGDLAPQAEADLLAMYPQYWTLRYHLWSMPPVTWPTQAFERFMSRHSGTYLADSLRGDWILAASRIGDWQRVRQLGDLHISNSHVVCAQMEARQATGSKLSPEDAMAAFEPINACWSLFDRLVADRVLSYEHLQYFLRNAIEQNKPDEASRFVGLMFGDAQRPMFDDMYKHPMRWLARQIKAPRDRMSQEMVAVALARLARTDREPGDAYVRREWIGQLPDADLAWVRSQFAIIAALNLDSRAHHWYTEAGHIPMTEYSQAWKVRSALRQPRIDWNWVEAAISHMPQSQQDETVWVYWRARARAALGTDGAARSMYARIAQQHDFYGQLAREELGQTIVPPPSPRPLTQQEIDRARNNPSLQRSIALFRLGWRAEAVPEWNFALRGMHDRELLAAAELARAEGLFDRVVNTSERTKTELDFSQRYIAPFEGRVSEQARSIGLDPAWVYGLIRQESRFVMDARSSVGASGLMQIMPGTARYVARKIGMQDFTPALVNDFDTNTILGTHYLNMVLQDLNGSQVLASAGYNAGPRRPHTWRGTLSHSVEGAIFAETIPFTETRLYVKHVLANAVNYAGLFTGQPQSLKARLGTIVPQAIENTDLP